MTFTSIVIAGGALKAASVIGCIKFLEERNAMKDLRNYVGTSAGALLCFMLVIGYSSKEIREVVLDCLYTQDIMSVNVEDLFNILTTYGMNSGTMLVDMVRRILFKKVKRNDITFIEIAKTYGKNLVVCVTNLTKETCEYMSVDTCPNMSVVDAIRISCSIPFFFTPVVLNDMYYVDGGLYNNFPIDYFNEHSLKDIIGINIINTNYTKTDSFIAYALFMLNSIIQKVNKGTYTNQEKNIITIEIEDTQWFSFSTMQFNFPKEKIDDYIKYGYEKMRQRLQ